MNEDNSLGKQTAIGISFKQGDKYPRVYEVETGREIIGITSAEITIGPDEHFQPLVYLTLVPGQFEFEVARDHVFAREEDFPHEDEMKLEGD